VVVKEEAMVIINGRKFAIDPIHEEKGQWYMWQETWADRGGPFDSRKEAEVYLEEYCKVIDREHGQWRRNQAWREK
jgi:hypothetical protein